jgi:hypothetical protein
MINPDRAITVNKLTISGLILNHTKTLYRDTRIAQKALYLDGKNPAMVLTHQRLLPIPAGRYKA